MCIYVQIRICLNITFDFASSWATVHLHFKAIVIVFGHKRIDIHKHLCTNVSMYIFSIIYVSKKISCICGRMGLYTHTYKIGGTYVQNIRGEQTHFPKSTHPNTQKKLSCYYVITSISIELNNSMKICVWHIFIYVLCLHAHMHSYIFSMVAPAFYDMHTYA